MGHVTEKLYNVGAYGLTLTNIIVDFESIKSAVLFVGALVLLAMQIKLHWIKIKKEKKD